jgi:hypothetical protein
MMKTFNGIAMTGALIFAACLTSAQTSTDLEIKRAYKNLIEAENRHDLAAVKGMVWDSPSALFVAKAPVGWRGYWGHRRCDAASSRHVPAAVPDRSGL